MKTTTLEAVALGPITLTVLKYGVVQARKGLTGAVVFEGSVQEFAAWCVAPVSA